MKKTTTLTKQLITLTLIFASFISCENDDDIIANDLPKLIRIINNVALNAGDTVFEYGQNGYLIKVSNNTRRTEILYNSNNQVVKIIQGFNGNAFPPGNIVTFNYEDDKIVSSYRGSNQNNLTHYFYNQEEQLTQMEGTDVFTYFYTYDTSGNLIEVLSENNGTPRSLVSYEFDDKINPLQFMFPEAFNKIINHYDYLPYAKNNANNIVSRTVTSLINDDSSTGPETVYAYNSNDLPISFTEESSSSIPYEYVYE